MGEFQGTGGTAAQVGREEGRKVERVLENLEKKKIVLPLFCNEVTALEKLTHLARLGQTVSKEKGSKKVIERRERVVDVTQR